MSTSPFKSPPRPPRRLVSEPLELPPPLELKTQIKPSMFQRLLPIAMVVAMLAMIILFIAMRQFNMYMLFMVIMILSGVMGYSVVGGQGGTSLSEVDADRRGYLLALRELRKEVHVRGSDIHTLQVSNFPNPKSLTSLIGRQTMWQATSTPATKDEPGQATPPPLTPHMLARIGVGTIRMYPPLKPADVLIPDNTEPLTTIAHTLFYRNQNFIPNTPVIAPLRSHPVCSFEGDGKMVVSLARSMILDIAYNHSPKHLAIGVITNDQSRDDWDWLKWLPHVQNPARREENGSARLAWQSMADFAEQMTPLIMEREEWKSKPSGKLPFYLIFVDTPGNTVAFPNTIPPSGIDGAAFFVLRRSGFNCPEPPFRYHVSSKTGISTDNPKRTNIAIPDQTSVLEATVAAMNMSRFRPPGWGTSMPTDDTDDATPLATRNYFDILDIADISKFDPREKWRKNSTGSNMNVPLGFVHDGTNALDKLVWLDIAEASLDGTGPHGVFQGMTGSGKSFLLTAYVLTMCTYFGPEKLNFILMDFKGGATFPDFQILPHVVANITNLDEEIELVSRLGDVIDGEITRRERLLREHDGAKDIIEYRKMSERDPVKHPPLPDLVIIADEFREYMTEHRDELNRFIRVGTVGRSLGIHVLPCSQYIDSTLLRDLMEHLTFGISLRASNDQYSRTVVGTPEAAKLPMGDGQAIIRKTSLKEGETTTRFVGFNTEEQYVPRKHVVEAVEDAVEGAKVVQAFHLSNQFQDDAPATDKTSTSSRKLSAGEFPKSEQMKFTLLRHLSKFQEVKARQLWQPTLRAPITYSDVKVPVATSSKLSFRIGDIDAPRQHKRLPYVISPESGKEHTLILGRGHSGRSTVVEAMVCSSGLSYQARFVSWCLIDYGGTKLAEVANMPNVCGYAAKSDTDKIERYLGEVIRIRNLREDEFINRNVSTLDAYMQTKVDDPVDEDPYGHLFLVIDGITSFMADHEDAIERLTKIMDGGGRYGLHVVLTGERELKLYNLLNFIGTRVYLKVEDPNELGTLQRPAREMVRAIPDNQPGRALDPATGLAARILVPQYERIEPIGIDDKSLLPMFDENADYSSGIRSMAERRRSDYTDPSQLAPIIEVVPGEIDYSILWRIYDERKAVPDPAALAHGRRRALDTHFPLGFSAEDLTTVTIPDNPSPHMLWMGDSESGKTAALRSALNSIVRQYGPDEAQIVLADKSFTMYPEKELLDEMGYLVGYAEDAASFGAAMSRAAELIADRVPSQENTPTTTEIRNRSWYSGPEVFVLVDNVEDFPPSDQHMPSSVKSGMDTVIEMVSGRTDVGVHVYATGPAQGFSMKQDTHPLYKAMLGKNTAVAFLAGPSSEKPLPGGARFDRRRPGLAQLYTPHNTVLEMVQIAHARSWEESDAAPPQDVIDRARAIKAEMLRNRPVPKPVEKLTWFDVLGIKQLEEYDPRVRWAENHSDSAFKVPLGFEHDGNRLLENLVFLDISEASQGGSGPHGAIQGITGAGKSFLLTAYVLTLCSFFGPEKLNLVLMDFKGGSTFDGFSRLPHVVANITNLDNEIELVARLGDVIAGEITRRENLFRQVGARDMIEYRKMSLKEPDKYDPLPELVLIADEFKEFMVQHPEYITLFTSVGAVGRSLGIHIIPCSQFIDSSILRDLMEHLTFGISLKASSEAYSKTVIGVPDAFHLVQKEYRAFIRASEELHRFMSFNTEARYIPGGGEDPQFDKEVEKEDTMKVRLLDHIAKFDEVKALSLWKPTLRAPITYADVEVPRATSAKLSFRIGDIDAPRQHTRLPFTVTPEAGKEHILILGRGHSGASTLIEAMTCSSAMAYSPRYVSWYLIDYGGTKLGEIESLPNVGGYATKSDMEKVHRLISEAIRIRRLREKMFTQRKLSTLESYLESREANPVEDDPYGHIFLVIDGYAAYLKDNEDAKTRMMEILDGGERYGIHLVATASDEMKLSQHASLFGTRLLLKLEDVSGVMGAEQNVKEALKLMPPDQPGRAVDTASALHARVLVPQREKIEPERIDAALGSEIFDPTRDYSANIRALAEELRSVWDGEHAPIVDTVSHDIPYADVWAEFETTQLAISVGAKGRRPSLDLKLPVGVSAESLKVLALPDDVSPHAMILGDPMTGRTVFLRTVINSIIRQFDPSQAQIVIADAKGDLFAEKYLLEEMGYLLGYADSDETLTKVSKRVGKIIRPRVPSSSLKMTAEIRRNRSWYTGPDVFVLIDDMTMFSRGSSGYAAEDNGIDALIEMVKLRSDNGLHVYVTGPASKFSANQTMYRLPEAMLETNCPVVMLSGPLTEPAISPGVKFATRKPGEAMLFIPSSDSTEVLQLAHSLSWETEGQEGVLPPQSVISRAEGMKGELPSYAEEPSDDGEVSESSDSSSDGGNTTGSVSGKHRKLSGLKWGAPPS